jgi:hypothetical protein
MFVTKLNRFFFGNISNILCFYKSIFYFSTSDGFLCILNLKKNIKTNFLAKKICVKSIIGLFVKKKKVLVFDEIGFYSFFVITNFPRHRKILCKKLKLRLKQNLSFNKYYLVLYINNFFLIWINSKYCFKKQPLVMVKLNNSSILYSVCYLASKRNLIASSFSSLSGKNCTKIYKIKKFDKLVFFIELDVIIKNKKNKIPISDSFAFSSNGKFLCGINKCKKKIFMLKIKKKHVFLTFIRILSNDKSFQKDKFCKITLVKKIIIIITEFNSILAIDSNEGFLVYKKDFLNNQKIKAISTNFRKNSLLSILFEDGKIKTYNIKKENIHKANQFLLTNLKISHLNSFDENNKYEAFKINNGLIIIPFFFRLKKNNKTNVFQKYLLKKCQSTIHVIHTSRICFKKLSILRFV